MSIETYTNITQTKINNNTEQHPNKTNAVDLFGRIIQRLIFPTGRGHATKISHKNRKGLLNEFNERWMSSLET